MQPVLEAFVAAHQRVVGTPYPVVGARDAQAIRRLPAWYTTERLLQAVQRYFADAFNLRGVVSVPMCMAKAGTLLGRQMSPPRGGSPQPSSETKQYRADELDALRRAARGGRNA